jgi:hypothetical protein
MKDSEFLELLNLYLDHEITAVDAARLEAEVRNNGQRRAVYHDYCRMQKACKILVADYQQEGQGATQGASAGKIIAFDRPAAVRAHRIGYYVASSVALAAACVVLMLGIREKRQPAANISPARNQSVAVAPAAKASPTTGRLVLATNNTVPFGLVAVAGAPGRSERSKVTLVSDSLVLSGSRQADAVLAAAMAPADDQLAWMRDFQLVPLQERTQLEQLRFEAAPPTLRPEGRQLGGRAPAETTVEMTAFRFVK